MAPYENGLAGAVNGDNIVYVPVVNRDIEREWARRNSAQVAAHRVRPIDDGDRAPELYREYDDYTELDARRDRATRTIQVWQATGRQADQELTALVMFGRTQLPRWRTRLEGYGYPTHIIDACPAAFPPAPPMTDAEIAAHGSADDV